ncbi:MAG: pucA [Phycisphaerales bacterium]|nr:pucA [Phycisphaerales bacterium]
MIDVLPDILRRVDAGQPVALCTVVRTRGSAPQKAGAVLVVAQDGGTSGTIGGGCVEAEVRTRALRLLAAAGPAPVPAGRLFTFKLDHDLGWDDGLVCGGTMEVAVEVIDSPAAAVGLRRAAADLAAERTATVTVFATDDAGRTAAFERAVLPTPSLVIAGAGHVGAALAAVARLTDFRVTVIDDRPDLASASRFPGADCIIGEIEEVLARFPITPHTYVVIVTRGHRRDGRALAAVVNSPAAYVGLIGSRRKIVTIFEELAAAGVPRDALRRVRAPIGLDVGAVTPAEIAVSIAAELVAVRRGAGDRAAGPMRLADEVFDRALAEVRPVAL